MKIEVPGVLWTIVFVVLSMLPAWLNDTFSGAVWLSGVVGALLIVTKVWLVLKTPDAPAPPDGVMLASRPVEQRGTVNRVLFG